MSDEPRDQADFDEPNEPVDPIDPIDPIETRDAPARKRARFNDDVGRAAAREAAELAECVAGVRQRPAHHAPMLLRAEALEPAKPAEPAQPAATKQAAASCLPAVMGLRMLSVGDNGLPCYLVGPRDLVLAYQRAWSRSPDIMVDADGVATCPHHSPPNRPGPPGLETWWRSRGQALGALTGAWTEPVEPVDRWVERETVARMLVLGPDNVRGGEWTTDRLSPEQLARLYEAARAHGVCAECGQPAHDEACGAPAPWRLALSTALRTNH